MGGGQCVQQCRNGHVQKRPVTVRVFYYPGGDLLTSPLSKIRISNPLPPTEKYPHYTEADPLLPRSAYATTLLQPRQLCAVLPVSRVGDPHPAHPTESPICAVRCSAGATAGVA